MHLLRKGAYTYEYMDEWWKFKETSLPKKHNFYSNLNIEYITGSDYNHVKKVCKNFKTKKMAEYHDLYLKGYILLLAHFFENIRKILRNLWTRSYNSFLSSSISMGSSFKKY